MSSCPEPEALDRLARFARNGRLTDIEQWIETYAAHADYADFLEEVRRRLDALDFRAIEVLVEALISPHVTVEDSGS